MGRAISFCSSELISGFDSSFKIKSDKFRPLISLMAIFKSLVECILVVVASGGASYALKWVGGR